MLLDTKCVRFLAYLNISLLNDSSCLYFFASLFEKLDHHTHNRNALLDFFHRIEADFGAPPSFQGRPEFLTLNPLNSDPQVSV